MTEEGPDALEKGVRFGCGFIFGLVMGAASFVIALADDMSSYAIGTLVLAIVCGVAALRYGDAFWNWLARNWRFWA